MRGKHEPAPRENKNALPFGSEGRGLEGRGGTGPDIPHRTDTNTDHGKKVWGPRPPLFLTSIKDCFFDSRHWTLMAVTTIRGDLVLQELCCKYLVIGDTKCIPPEIEISLIALLVDPEGLFLLAWCAHPPFYPPKGQTLLRPFPFQQTYPSTTMPLMSTGRR